MKNKFFNGYLFEPAKEKVPQNDIVLERKGDWPETLFEQIRASLDMEDALKKLPPSYVQDQLTKEM